jgi:glycosyltransferase involved in cell wall biosynthesis
MNIQVSIACLIYNHEKYIDKAILGFISQKTSFKFEIILCDDFSTDNTASIIENYLFKKDCNYSIKYFKHPTPIGMSKNLLFCLNNCSGKYIAFCDGDDYWIDENKLQKQVDFLEKNLNYVMCYHNVKILENQVLIDDILKCKNISNKSSYNDLLCFGKYMQTCSVVFRNEIPKFPFNNVNYLNDYIFWFWVSQFGNIYRIDEVMAVYRYGSGIWSVKSSFEKKIDSLNALIEAKKIVREKNDIVILDYRIKALTLELLPLNLQRLNLVSDSLNVYLSKNIYFHGLIISLLLKFYRIFIRGTIK